MTSVAPPTTDRITAEEVQAFLAAAEHRIDEEWDRFLEDEDTRPTLKVPTFEAETMRPVPPTLRSGELPDGTEAWMPSWLFIEGVNA